MRDGCGMVSKRINKLQIKVFKDGRLRDLLSTPLEGAARRTEEVWRQDNKRHKGTWVPRSPKVCVHAWQCTHGSAHPSGPPHAPCRAQCCGARALQVPSVLTAHDVWMSMTH